MDGYRISVIFTDGARKVMDFEPLTRQYPVFRPLQDLRLFQDFVVTDTLEWDNGKIDIAPEYIYEHGMPEAA